MIEQNPKKTNPVAITFEEAFDFLKIDSVMAKLGFNKRSGASCWELFLVVFGSVFHHCPNIFRFFKGKYAKKDVDFSRDTAYRFMNNPRFNFRGLQRALAAKIIGHFMELNSSRKDPCRVLSLTIP